MKHKSRITNRMANALSRRKSLLIRIRVEIPTLDSFFKLFETDPHFSSILANTRAGEKTNFSLHDGFFFFKG